MLPTDFLIGHTDRHLRGSISCISIHRTLFCREIILIFRSMAKSANLYHAMLTPLYKEKRFFYCAPVPGSPAQAHSVCQPIMMGGISSGSRIVSPLVVMISSASNWMTSSLGSWYSSFKGSPSFRIQEWAEARPRPASEAPWFQRFRGALFPVDRKAGSFREVSIPVAPKAGSAPIV